ncbi:hypothetical protein MTR67_002898 [Solanum verrucosum]|uniref:Reverse transcriptase/retrotransposon-derived protein RNase H-like domain-containing protein n=1 Tax=Solanum verrucosum TaxID=315347 RepID=A0AAF0PRE9_SOLVR|nr:hypothetical protein MTR67_002898 [Solanum verrucosum]
MEGFSSIDSPFTKLTEEKVKFQWSDKCKKNISELKTRLTTAPVLTLPDGSEDYAIYRDASKVGLGCVLMQRGKVIACASRQLKVSLVKGVMRFGKKEKLSPRYVGPYEILKRVCKVAYELELPAKLAAVHPVFHISLLKKCVGDPASIVPLESVDVKDSLTYEEVLVGILDRQKQPSRPSTLTSSLLIPFQLEHIFMIMELKSD